MERSEENSTNKQLSGRPAIARRSCDQCRARKIGCDRRSPCCNCVSARLACAHSAVAVKATPPKQRVLISTQYEQKIDGIARDVDGIRLLLQGMSEPQEARLQDPGSIKQINQVNSISLPTKDHPVCSYGGEPPPWDKSAHIIEFVKAVVEDGGSRVIGAEKTEVLASLRKLIQSLERPTAVSTVRNLSYRESRILPKDDSDDIMPPQESVVAVLRWAKDHAGSTRMTFISKILPLQKFTEICQKVYFAVDDYGEIDYILTNGYLTYVYSEHVTLSADQKYREYYQLCQKNFHRAFTRLPFLLPTSLEVVAMLTLAGFNAIENSKTSMAWTFISAASSLCQTLGYHRQPPLTEIEQPMLEVQERLFWTLYQLEKELSLRLSRPSNIRDAEITRLLPPNESRQTRFARIQGRVYDQLYSPVGLSLTANERAFMAEGLARELRHLINETDVEFSSVMKALKSGDAEAIRLIYLQCDLVCQYSVLSLILRAIPNVRGQLNGVSDDCVTVARYALDIHQQCNKRVQESNFDSSMVTKYINSTISHTPFVPFSILFTRAIQILDITDLPRLDSFAASFQPEAASPQMSTHPFRLYELLCQAVRLYIDPGIPYSPDQSILSRGTPESLENFDFEQFGLEMETGVDETLDASENQSLGLSGWYYSNQQIMNMIDEEGIS